MPSRVWFVKTMWSDSSGPRFWNHTGWIQISTSPFLSCMSLDKSLNLSVLCKMGVNYWLYLPCYVIFDCSLANIHSQPWVVFLPPYPCWPWYGLWVGVTACQSQEWYREFSLALWHSCITRKRTCPGKLFPEWPETCWTCLNATHSLGPGLPCAQRSPKLGPAAELSLHCPGHSQPAAQWEIQYMPVAVSYWVSSGLLQGIISAIANT